MAEVHQAYDTSLSRIVAIKMLRVDLAKDSVFLARFRREALASASLNHENIVQVYDTGEQTVTTPDGTEVHVPLYRNGAGRRAHGAPAPYRRTAGSH